MASAPSVDREQYCSPTFRDALYLRLISAVFAEDNNSSLASVLQELQTLDSQELARREKELEMATEGGILRLSKGPTEGGILNLNQGPTEGGILSLSQGPTPILGRLQVEEMQSKLPPLLREELLCSPRPFPQELLQDADDALMTRVLDCMLDVLHFLDVRAEMEKKATLQEKVREAVKNYRGTPLHYAAGCSAADKVLLLLEKGADMHAKDCHDRNAIQVCPPQASALAQATLDCFYKASYVTEFPSEVDTVRVGSL